MQQQCRCVSFLFLVRSQVVTLCCMPGVSCKSVCGVLCAVCGVRLACVCGVAVCGVRAVATAVSSNFQFFNFSCNESTKDLSARIYPSHAKIYPHIRYPPVCSIRMERISVRLPNLLYPPADIRSSTQIYPLSG